ncbi:uncharacterized abhydrolase domain-containing protein DDB_G0269086-like [Trichoplusia ni]|uniref:Uncharacterized abhydrolase domain-containing protein DDB_G0269086-like n=1 Tax=Trichoplusia ni TaxID=7111 RepID=A0A7E5W617_TRINI|nr:uncharacterized abhydrolase domain-containing protein DDB_G0269086-like [Trichoplusia ni]
MVMLSGGNGVSRSPRPSEISRERREAEQRKRLDELRAHAAAAQAQREKRDEDRRRRQAEQRAKDDERRVQVEERKRAIWEASISRREALLQRERDRTERLERQRAARSAPRPAFAFGSSTPRLLEPVDSAGFFWAARSTNPIDQMNFFESLAASTTNVMFASAPLTRRASALHLDSSDTDNKDEPERSPQPVMWSSVARRRTDLVPTVPAPRPGRAYSMTRLDRLPPQRPLASASPSLHHLNRAQPRSGDTTPGSRPGSALAGAVPRRPASAPRKPRPASIAGTGVNTPRGGGDTLSLSVATTPSVSRDSTVMAGGDAPRRPHTAPRRPRPASMHAGAKPVTPVAPGEGKPPVHRKPKPSKDHEKAARGKSLSASPGRTLSPSPAASKEPSVDKEIAKPAAAPAAALDKSQVDALEVTHKLEALQIQNGHAHHDNDKSNEIKETIEDKQETKIEQVTEVVKHEERMVIEKEKREDKEERKEPSVEKTEENEMTASMTARRITTEEQAKAALAERRRRAREELERQAERERLRLQREAEEEAERQRLEEERQRKEEDEARELARLQRAMEEEKLRKAIEAQQQLEREEAERKTREEAERQARLREDEEKRKAAEEAEKLRREEAEKEEKERLARKQRVEAIMARTRLRKQAEEEKKQAAPAAAATEPTPTPTAAPAEATPTPTAMPTPTPAQEVAAPTDNGNAPTQTQESKPVEAAPAAESAAPPAATNNGNVTADLLGLSQTHATEDKPAEQTTTIKLPTNDNAPITNTPIEANNGNVPQPANIGHISANFIQTERMSNESQTKMADVPKILDDDFTTHNGHGATHNHPLTLQNAI